MSEEKPKAGMPRARKIRFAIYAVILLASLLWQRHERVVNEAIAVENKAVDTAYALVEKASSSEDPAEQLRLYDEIINTYQNDATGRTDRVVSWSLYKKALLLTDTSEKSRLLEEVVDKYGHDPDKQVKGYVYSSLKERLEMAGSGAEKVAICDTFLGKKINRDGLTAELLYYKAKNTPGMADKITIYDAIIQFISSNDKDAFDYAVIAAMDKVESIREKNEQIRLCDLAIEAFLKTPQNTRYYLFDRAIRKKAELVGDPSLPLKLWDQVIANNVTEDSVLQARAQRIRLLKDDRARLAAYDETINIHQNSKSDFAQLMVARAMADKAELLTDAKAKAELWRAVVEKCEKIKDSRAKDLANRTVANLAKLTGDSTSATQYYDKKVAASENTLEALRTLESKARVIKDRAGKIAVYDEIIAKGAQSDSAREMGIIQNAMYEKAKLIVNNDEKIKIYDALLFDKIHVENAFFLASIVLSDRVDLANDDQEKLKLYDRYMSTYGDTLKPESKISLLVDRAEILSDPAEKLDLYDEIIASCEQVLSNWKNGGEASDHDKYDKDRLMYDFGKAILGKADLLGTAEEEIKLYDHYLAFPQVSRNFLSDRVFEEILFKKGELTGQPGLKNEYFESKIQAATTDSERIRWYRRKLNETSIAEKGALEDEIIAKFFDSTEENVEEFVAMLLALKIQKTENVQEKSQIIERVLARYQNSGGKRTQAAVVASLVQKAEIASDDKSKLEQYSTVIEKYKDNEDYFVKSAVDEAIVAKARLEMKMEQEAAGKSTE